MIAALLIAASTAAPHGLPAEDGFRLPEGFRLEVVLEERHSYLALALDAEGRVLLATEEAGLLRASDEDGDGRLERLEALLPELARAQGLCVVDDALLAVGRLEGRSGLWRLAYPDPRAGEAEALLRFEDDDEHGAHAAVLGPDGDLWLSLGDQTQVLEPPPAAAFPRRELPPLLPALDDPTGFGQGTRFPYGRLVRVDLATGAWRVHSGGHRNAYDLAFDGAGEPWVVDSDMEWDQGLPWYRPTRLCLALAGADLGHRPGSRVEAAGLADIAPAVLELGPGSPTGIVRVEHPAFPARYGGAFLSADWARGVVDALWPEPEGAGYGARREPLIEARGAFQVTDLEFDRDGSLLLVTGGRASMGALWRLSHGQERRAAEGTTLELVLAEPLPASAAARARAARVRERLGERWSEALREVLLDGQRAERERLRALGLLRLEGADPGLAPGALADAPRALRRLAAGWPAAHAALGAGDVEDPLVLRRRLETGGVVALPPAPDRWLRHGLRGALARGLEVSVAPDANADARVRHELDRLLAELRVGRPSTGRIPSLAEAFPRATDLELACELLHGMVAGLRGLEPGERRAELVAPALEVLLRRPWIARPDHDRPAARLLALLGGPRALDPLLARLSDPDAPREERLDLALALRGAQRGWTPDRRARLLGLFDEAVRWRGGANHLRYVEQLTLDAARRTEPALALALAREGRLGPWSLAQLVAAQPAPVAQRLLPAIQEAFEGAEDSTDRRVLLRALGASGAEALLPWLREVARRDEALRVDVLFAVAPVAGREDLELLLEGLGLGSSQLAETCARRLVQLGGVAACAGSDAQLRARAVRECLRVARTSSTRVGRQLVRVLELEFSDAQPDATQELDVRLVQLQELVDGRYPAPAVDASPLGPPARPRWELERVLAFLEASAGRPGSPHRGRAAYEAASCHTCHAMAGGTGAAEEAPVVDAGWGPDLTTVARRMPPAELLRHVFEPSLSVAERFRNTVLVTHDERILEGRLLREADGELELVDLAGRRSTVPVEEVAVRELSPLSPMPEGLLAERSLEEIKDLLAYLDAEGETGAQDSPWIDLLADPSGWSLGEGWSLGRGLLEGRAVGLLENSYAVAPGTYGDLELELDLLLTGDPTANSGLQYRSQLVPGRPDPVGYQVDAGTRVFGALYATDGRGELARSPAPVDETAWNHLHLRVEGDRHRIEWNGTPVLDLHDSRHPAGLLAIQLHERMDLAVRVANLRLRVLGP